MPAWRDPYSPTAPSRILLDALEHSSEPLTQIQLARTASVTVSWAHKCLQRLIEDGYAKEAGCSLFRRHGAKFGRFPKLYVHTGKPLPSHTSPAPTPRELADIMNEIIRRNVAAKRK